MLRRFFDGLYSLNNGFAEAVARVSSWRAWMTVITLGTAGVVGADSWIHHGFNPSSVAMTFLVLALTIQTSIDAQGQRLNQAEQRHIDDKRDAQFAEQLHAISELTLSIRSELDRGAERDDASAQRDDAARIRDDALLELFQRLVGILQVLEDPVNRDKWAAELARLKSIRPAQ